MPNRWHPAPAEERFSAKYVVLPNGCWEWSGYRDKDGYGSFRASPRSNGNVRAHRWAYEHFIGPIPDGLVLDHTSCTYSRRLTRRQRTDGFTTAGRGVSLPAVRMTGWGQCGGRSPA